MWERGKRFEKMFENCLGEKRKLDEAECKRMNQESGSFKNFLKTQQQAEERRFQRMPEQQGASNQLSFQMMSDFLYVAMPQSMTPPTTQQWMPPTPVRPPSWPTGSSHQPSAHTHQTDNSFTIIHLPPA